MGTRSTPRSARGVYGISVVSELSGVAQQTLRLYERRGLLTPARTGGGTRRYSDDDLDRIKRITELVDEGVNLAGIARILELQDRNFDLESHNTRSKPDHLELTLQRRRREDGRAESSPRDRHASSRRR